MKTMLCAASVACLAAAVPASAITVTVTFEGEVEAVNGLNSPIMVGDMIELLVVGVDTAAPVPLSPRVDATGANDVLSLELESVTLSVPSRGLSRTSTNGSAAVLDNLPQPGGPVDVAAIVGELPDAAIFYAASFVNTLLPSADPDTVGAVFLTGPNFLTAGIEYFQTGSSAFGTCDAGQSCGFSTSAEAIDVMITDDMMPPVGGGDMGGDDGGMDDGGMAGGGGGVGMDDGKDSAPAPVPLPGGMALMAGALGLMGFARRRKG